MCGHRVWYAQGIQIQEHMLFPLGTLQTPLCPLPHCRAEWTVYHRPLTDADWHLGPATSKQQTCDWLLLECLSHKDIIS